MRKSQSYYSLLLICCLLFSGCEIASTDTPNTSPTATNSLADPSSPLGIKIVGDDANGNPIIQDFNYSVASDGRDEATNEIAIERSEYHMQIEEERHNKTIYQQLYVSKRPIPIVFKDEQTYEFIAAGKSLTDSLGKKASKLISAMYIYNYKEARQMQANIEAAYQPLLTPEAIKTLQDNGFAKKQASELANGELYCVPWSDTSNYIRMEHYDGMLRKLITNDNRTIYSIPYTCTFKIISRATNTVPKYICDNKLNIYDNISKMLAVTTHEYSTAFTINIYFDSLDADTKILGWEQTYARPLAQRYCSVYTGELKQGEEIFYTLPAPTGFPTKWDLMSTQDFKYQSVISTLNASANKLFSLFQTNANDIKDDHFQPILDAATPEFKAYLQQSKFFDGFITDIRKDNITIEFSKFFNSTITGKNSLRCYSTDAYGDVYAVQCYVPVKTGNDTFNKKYGFPIDREYLGIHFFYTKVQSDFKLIGFCITDQNDGYFDYSEAKYQELMYNAWETGAEG